MNALISCTKCARDLPPEAFHVRNASPNGRTTRCIECVNADRRARMQASPELRALRAQRNREYWQRNPEKLRERNIYVAYGITVEEYDAIMANPCAICGAKSQHLDHNHETKEIRGPLCSGCNLALGHLKDDPWRAEQAAIYLRKWSAGGDSN